MRSLPHRRQHYWGWVMQIAGNLRRWSNRTKDSANSNSYNYDHKRRGIRRVLLSLLLCLSYGCLMDNWECLRSHRLATPLSLSVSFPNGKNIIFLHHLHVLALHTLSLIAHRDEVVFSQWLLNHNVAFLSSVPKL